MRIALLVLVVLALSAGMAMAAANQDDGWAGYPTAGYDNELTGPSSATDYQTNWWLASGSTTSESWWDGDNSKWIPAGGGDDGLVVKAYVELYAKQSQQTNAVFHWGKPPFPAMSAVLNGSIVQNHPCWVGIRKAGWVAGDMTGKAAHLGWEKSFAAWPTGVVTSPAFPGTATGDTIADIPLTWAMNVDGGEYSAMQWTGGVGDANYGWYSIGRLPVGTHDYNFKITATPNLYQADGKYTLDPQIVVVPDL
jgi:hypothetical protein